MSLRIGEHIRSNVVGYIALFLALSMGTAYATHPGGANTISSGDIINGEVRTLDIGDRQVLNAQLAANAVTGGKIKDGEVKSVDIGDGRVKTADINDTDGVRSADVRDDTQAGGGLAAADLRPGAVATSELANGAVSIPKLGFDPATQPELDAHTSSGDHDGRYRTETELQTSDGSPPNAGSNFLHWDLLDGVPAGFADGSDATGAAELEAHKSSGDHDGRYRTETELQTSDGSPPNAGSNFLHWDLLDGVPAGFADGFDATGADWSLDGNSGTTGANFLGTTDDQPLNLRVNDARGLRLEPASNGTVQSPNVIGGIADNAVTAGVFAATIAGGGRRDPTDSSTANRVTDNFGTVGGGANNRAGNLGSVGDDRAFATVGGGSSNTASGSEATVGGGSGNVASGDIATVGGGNGNSASGLRATVAGGDLNGAFGVQATVGGGNSNDAIGTRATVGGGFNNTASGGGATVGGGLNNAASETGATVGGGNSNDASGDSATVDGGFNNTAAGDFSFVAGTRAKNADPAHDGVFLFADSTTTPVADFTSTAANEFAVRASGGFRFRTQNDLSTGCNLPAGTGVFACTSDVHTKEGFAAIDPGEILDRLAQLPVSAWRFRGEDDQVRHIGPTSQAFFDAFGLGSDRRSIGLPDANGIALASIKGLNEKVEALSGGTPTPGAGEASGLSISPAALAGIVVLAAMLASALTAALALRWSGRVGGRLAAS
jgi:endosialidase-like protein